MSAFSKLQHKIENKEPGLSEESARKITAKIGRDKLGSHEMAERAAKSREKHKGSRQECCKMSKRGDGSHEVKFGKFDQKKGGKVCPTCGAYECHMH